jgi:hypothetical protein
MARIVRGAGALGLVAAGLVLMTSPAWSDDRTVDDRAAYTKKTCEGIKHPPTGGLGKTTVPAPGSEVQAGDVIEIRLTWDTARWDGSRLHKAIDCVAVNGVLDMELSAEEKPTSNDGVFEHKLTVPDGLAPGTEICDRGFVSGDSHGGGFDQETSPVVCFTLGPPPETPETPETTTTTEITTTQPTVPTTTETPPPPQVQGEQEHHETAAPKPGPELVEAGPPGPPAAPAPAPPGSPAPPSSSGPGQPTIAATGAFAGQALTVASGLALMLGGLSLMGGARRP